MPFNSIYDLAYQAGAARRRSPRVVDLRPKTRAMPELVPPSNAERNAQHQREVADRAQQDAEFYAERAKRFQEYRQKQEETQQKQEELSRLSGSLVAGASPSAQEALQLSPKERGAYAEEAQPFVRARAKEALSALKKIRDAARTGKYGNAQIRELEQQLSQAYPELIDRRVLAMDSQQIAELQAIQKKTETREQLQTWIDGGMEGAPPLAYNQKGELEVIPGVTEYMRIAREREQQSKGPSPEEKTRRDALKALTSHSPDFDASPEERQRYHRAKQEHDRILEQEAFGSSSAPPADTAPVPNPTPVPSSGIPEVTTPAEYYALQPGQAYIDPTGTRRTKK